MTTAILLLLYGAAVTWLCPPLLSRLTRRGVNPRLGVAAWLTTIAAVIVTCAAALAIVAVAAVRGLADSTAVVLCLELLGVPEATATPGPAWLVALIVGGTTVAAVVTASVVRSVVRLRSRSREHAEAARLLGRPTDRPDVVVVEADRPAAYCVVGRPNAIVVTSAAVASLSPAQLAAVLAHEDAHIVGRHHHVLMVLRALAANLTRLPLFTVGAAAVAELLEMCADDSAARRHGTRPLIDGMIMLAGPPPHRAGLAIGAAAVVTRVTRLTEPVCRGTRWCHRLLVSTAIVATATAPVVINFICQH